MPSIFVRAYKPAGDPDALGDLTLAELAALRLTCAGKQPTTEDLSGLILRMKDQADIGQLVVIERRTRLPAKPVPLSYLQEVGEKDHYRVDPFFMGKSKFEVYERQMGSKTPTDAVAITFPPDRVEDVVTRQAGRALYAIDPGNWSDAALRWCDADKQLALHDVLESDSALPASDDLVRVPESGVYTNVPFQVFKKFAGGKWKGQSKGKSNLDSIHKNRKRTVYATAFNDDGTVIRPKFIEIARSRGEWADDGLAENLEADHTPRSDLTRITAGWRRP